MLNVKCTSYNLWCELYTICVPHGNMSLTAVYIRSPGDDRYLKTILTIILKSVHGLGEVQGPSSTLLYNVKFTSNAPQFTA